MDKNKMLENLRSQITGYSIEYGNTTYEDSLEERIQAAKAASLGIKQTQSPNVPELKKKKQYLSINNNVQDNYKPIPLKSTCKGGGSIQRRLESIKSNKKFSKMASFEPHSITSQESIKYSNNPSRTACPKTFIKNHNLNQLDTNYFKPSECQTRSTVRKHPSSEIDHRHNTLIGHYTKNVSCAQNYSNNSGNSVQNRLIKVKEEMKAKSKLTLQNDIAKTEMAKKLPVSENINLQDGHKWKNNLRNKTKRLTSTNENCTKKLSTLKKIKMIEPNFNKLIENKELVTVQPITPKRTLCNPVETIVSSKLENQNVLKRAQQTELDSFSFVLPKTFSVQQRLENKKKDPNNYLNIQLNNDDSMEWEDVEPNNIVDTVNDLRKTHDYEPMEWIPDIPDTVMYCDKVNYCFVLDTNILLLDLKSISLALDSNFRDYGFLTFVLPWQVFQELDHIKKQDDQLGFRAREATRWMLDKFASKHPRLKGQPMTNKGGGSNDDAILKCAIYLQSRVNHISLITDDHILSIKSEVNGISTKNSIWLKNLVSNASGIINESNIFQEAVKKYPTIDRNLIMKFEPHLEHFISRVLIFAIKQNESFPNFSQKVWLNLYELAPPFNLTKYLSNLKEYWDIIAPKELFKGPKKQLEWLSCFFLKLQTTTPEIYLNWNQLYDFLNNCFEVINALPFEYFHIIDALLNDLMEARECLKKKLSGMTPDELLNITQFGNLNVSNDNTLDVDQVLRNILREAESFCSYVYEVYDFHPGLTEKKLNDLNAKSEHFIKTVDNYCGKLFKIIKIMLKIKKCKTEQILESHIIVKEFYDAIVEFNYQEYHKLPEENVIDYCLMKDKNTFLTTLVYLQNNLAAVKNLVTIFKP